MEERQTVDDPQEKLLAYPPKAMRDTLLLPRLLGGELLPAWLLKLRHRP